MDKTLKETNLTYIDLMLLHAPYGGREARKAAWKALVEAHNKGKVRSIGVSNYGVHRMYREGSFFLDLLWQHP